MTNVILGLFVALISAGVLAAGERTVETIPPPEGYKRVAVRPGTFAASLREMIILPDTVITSGDGERLLCHEEKVAATRILPFDNKEDVGADGITRLWGEYVWSRGASRSKISFPMDNGQVASWADWSEGLRPRETSGRFVFTQVTTPDGSYGNYLRYLAFVAEEMGAIALRRESTIIPDDSLTVGDLAVAVAKDGTSRIGLILDVCKNQRGEKAYLLGTCGTPSTVLYIPRPYSPVQGVSDWYTLEGLKWEVGQGARTDMRRVTLK